MFISHLWTGAGFFFGLSRLNLSLSLWNRKTEQGGDASSYACLRGLWRSERQDGTKKKDKGWIGEGIERHTHTCIAVWFQLATLQSHVHFLQLGLWVDLLTGSRQLHCRVTRSHLENCIFVLISKQDGLFCFMEVFRWNVYLEHIYYSRVKFCFSHILDC